MFACNHITDIGLLIHCDNQPTTNKPKLRRFFGFIITFYEVPTVFLPFSYKIISNNWLVLPAYHNMLSKSRITEFLLIKFKVEFA